MMCQQLAINVENMCQLNRNDIVTLGSTFHSFTYYKLGLCLEGVWRMSGGYLEVVWRMSGGCLEGVWRVSGGCLGRWVVGGY